MVIARVRVSQCNESEVCVCVLPAVFFMDPISRLDSNRILTSSFYVSAATLIVFIGKRVCFAPRLHHWS